MPTLTVENIHHDAQKYATTFAENIKTGVYYKNSFRDVCTPYPTSSDGWVVLPRFAIADSVLQAYQSGFFANGAGKFDSTSLQVVRFGIDTDYDPVDLYDKWVAKLQRLRMQGITPTADDMNIGAFLISEIEKKRVEEFEFYAIGAGYVEGAFEEGKINPVRYKGDGLRTQYKKFVKAGILEPLSEEIFPLDPDSAYDYTNAAIDMLDSKYQLAEMNAYTSPAVARKYKQKIKTFGYNLAEREMMDARNVGKVLIDDSNTSISGHPGFANQRFMLLTPPDNMFLLEGKYNPYRVIPAKSMQVTMNYGTGIGASDPRLVFGFGEQIEAPSIYNIRNITTTTAKVCVDIVPEATAMYYEVATDKDFANIVVAQTAFSSITPTKAYITTASGKSSYQYEILSQDIAGLSVNTVYYVRVYSGMEVEAGPNAGHEYMSMPSAPYKFKTLTA